MNLGFIGLGKMGKAMARCLAKEYFVYAYDSDKNAINKAGGGKLAGVYSLDLFQNVFEESPRKFWLMVPHKAVDDVLNSLYLEAGDIIVDGGNSYFKDSIRRSKQLSQKGVYFLDVGTSGGLEGTINGFCLMIGGDKKAYKEMEPVFKLLAAPNAYSHVGKSGAGHFVKAVHNMIEYSLMHSYAEGFDLLKNGPYKNLDLKAISQLYNNKSIIRSYLLELVVNIFEKDPNLENIEGFVEGGDSGSWALNEGLERGIDLKLASDAILARQLSQEGKSWDSFADKFLAYLRNEFGGHSIKKKE